MKSTKKGKIGFGVLVTVTVILMIFPFVWQVITSFKTPGEIFQVPPSLLPDHLYTKITRMYLPPAFHSTGICGTV